MRRRDRQVTDPEAIQAIIEAADSCCVGMVDTSGPSPRPYVVALNYGFEPESGEALLGTFWFHSALEGRKLDLLRRNPQICLQLHCDHLPVTHALNCGWGMKYASVVAEGRGIIVHDPAERQRGLDCIMRHYRRLWGPSAAPPGRAVEAETAQQGLKDSLAYEEKVLAITAVIRMDVESLTAKRKA